MKIFVVYFVVLGFFSLLPSEHQVAISDDWRLKPFLIFIVRLKGNQYKSLCFLKYKSTKLV